MLCNADLQGAAARRYAVDQLTWLVAETSATAAPVYLANLQQRIEECDRAGSRNRSVPASESTDTFVDIVAAATSRADVEEALAGLS